MQTTLPIRLVLTFTSLLDANTWSPCTTTDALSPRWLILWLQSFLPVRAWNALTVPSPAPNRTVRWPAMLATTGVLYGASTGMPPVPSDQRSSPVFLSKQNRRWFERAWSPQPKATPATNSWSSSTVGLGVRPPKVEIIPNSSVICRRHTTLPLSPSRQTSVVCAPSPYTRPGLRVADDVRPAEPVERHVGLGHVLGCGPDDLAGVGVDGDQRLLRLGPATSVSAASTSPMRV
jgi:hypothetical protein